MSGTNGRHRHNGTSPRADAGARIGSRGADSERGVVIRGTSGFVAGHEIRVRYGRSVTVGRSRSADLSLQRCDRFVENPDPKDDAFLRVSRIHVEVSYLHPRMVEIRNAGRNAVRVDGRAIDRVVLTDLDRPVVVDFGAEERLELAWGSAGEEVAEVDDPATRSGRAEEENEHADENAMRSPEGQTLP